ncbi:hypothetical protein AURDEDRAFT_115123 [Auricularia subglabra TFB-10046 SS5]|nr:hypothetical protein AURDEDRAFT_115123 [Auricularia subglabra TFB-10046 SS5]
MAQPRRCRENPSRTLLRNWFLQKRINCGLDSLTAVRFPAADVERCEPSRRLMMLRLRQRRMPVPDEATQVLGVTIDVKATIVECYRGELIARPGALWIGLVEHMA